MGDVSFITAYVAYASTTVLTKLNRLNRDLRRTRLVFTCVPGRYVA